MLSLFDVETPAPADHYVGACTDGHGVRYTVEEVETARRTLAYVPCRVTACKAPARVARMRAAYAAGIRCNAACQGATGPACTCSCAGRNHGAIFA